MFTSNAFVFIQHYTINLPLKSQNNIIDHTTVTLDKTTLPNPKLTVDFIYLSIF